MLNDVSHNRNVFNNIQNCLVFSVVHCVVPWQMAGGHVIHS